MSYVRNMLNRIDLIAHLPPIGMTAMFVFAMLGGSVNMSDETVIKIIAYMTAYPVLRWVVHGNPCRWNHWWLVLNAGWLCLYVYEVVS